VALFGGDGVRLTEREGESKMELRHLTTFRTVAKALSFTRAASRLGYAQLSVTDIEAST
jgi:hypothetical protein